MGPVVPRYLKINKVYPPIYSAGWLPAAASPAIPTVSLFTYLPTYLPFYLPTFLPTFLPTYLPTDLPARRIARLPARFFGLSRVRVSWTRIENSTDSKSIVSFNKKKKKEIKEKKKKKKKPAPLVIASSSTRGTVDSIDPETQHRGDSRGFSRHPRSNLSEKVVSSVRTNDNRPPRRDPPVATSS